MIVGLGNNHRYFFNTLGERTTVFSSVGLSACGQTVRHLPLGMIVGYGVNAMNFLMDSLDCRKSRSISSSRRPSGGNIP